MAENDTANPKTDSEQEPSEPFSLVSHAIRAEILQIFWKGSEKSFLSLSDVRERMTADVEPSQLHYHLQRLVGQFIEHTDDGYFLLPAGARVVASLRSESFTPHQETMTGPAGFDCDHCGRPVDASLENGVVAIECSDCDYTYFKYPLIYIPLDTFDDDSSAFRQFRKFMALNDLFIARKVCPNCGHALRTEFFADEDHPGDNKVCIDMGCGHCGIGWGLSIGEVLRADPGLVGFCHDHNLDILTIPHWELESVLGDDCVTIRSTDPWVVALEVTFDDDTLKLVVDGDLNVIERNRLASSDDAGMIAVSDIIGSDRTIHGEEDDAVVILPDQSDCLQYFRRLRWPDGVTCPHCTSSDTIKKGATSKDTQRYQCHNCNSTFTDLTGTIFAEHRLSLAEMFHIIWEMEDTNPEEIAQQLDRTPRAVQEFVHKVEDEPAEQSDFELSDIC